MWKYSRIYSNRYQCDIPCHMKSSKNTSRICLSENIIRMNIERLDIRDAIISCEYFNDISSNALTIGIIHKYIDVDANSRSQLERMVEIYIDIPVRRESLLVFVSVPESQDIGYLIGKYPMRRGPCENI